MPLAPSVEIPPGFSPGAQMRVSRLAWLNLEWAGTLAGFRNLNYTGPREGGRRAVTKDKLLTLLVEDARDINRFVSYCK